MIEFAVLGDVKIALMVVMFQQAIVHGSWMDHGCMADQGEGIIASGLVVTGSSIILFVQPFPQYLIKVGYGGRGGGGRLSSLYRVGVCICTSCKKKCVLKNELTNRQHSIITLDSNFAYARR